MPIGPAGPIERPDAGQDWYRLFFHSRDHEVFITLDADDDPSVVAIVKEVAVFEDVAGKGYQYRVIVFQKGGKDQVAIPLYDDDVYNVGQILEVAAPNFAAKKV